MHQSLQYRRFQIVRDHPLRHPSKILERPLVQGNPGRHLLVKDQFGILVAAVSQCRHKHIGCPQALG